MFLVFMPYHIRLTTLNIDPHNTHASAIHHHMVVQPYNPQHVTHAILLIDHVLHRLSAVALVPGAVPRLEQRRQNRNPTGAAPRLECCAVAEPRT